MKKWLYAAFAVFLFIIFISGCEVEMKEANGQESEYKLYGISTDETKLTETAYWPQEETQEFMVKDLMQYLGNQKAEEPASNLLPEGVKINSYDLQENLLIVDFNPKYLKIARVKEVLVRAGIVKTFLQVPGIEKVQFRVEGNELCDSQKKPIGEMDASTFAEYDGYDLDTYRYDTFTLYFADKTGKKLKKEQRSIYYRGDLSREKVVMEQLARGPMVKGNYPSIPEDTKANRISTADGICYVDLNSNFVDQVMDVEEEVTIYSIVNSLLANCEADCVQISVDGQQECTFGADTPLYVFYKMNKEIIKKNRKSS